MAAHGIDLAFAFAPDAAKAVEHAHAALPVIEAYRAEAAGLSAPLPATAVRALDLPALDAEWAEANGSIFFLAGKRRAAVARKLNPGAQADPARDLPILRRLQATLGRLDELAPAAAPVPGWAGTDTDVARLLYDMGRTGTSDIDRPIMDVVQDRVYRVFSSKNRFTEAVVWCV